MGPKLKYPSQQDLPGSRDGVRAVITTAEYQGCKISVRTGRTANGVHASYEVSADPIGTSWTFEASSDDPPEAADPRYLLERAKCEIDFALEAEF